MSSDKKRKPMSRRRLAFYIILGCIPLVLAFFLFRGAMSYIGEKTFQHYISIFNDHFGIFALAFYIWITDTFILPLSPMFAFPMLVQYGPFKAILASSAASALGGISAYYIGRLLVKIPLISRSAVKAHEKWGATIDKYGVGFVLIASIFPLPFSAICMAAGVMKLPQRQVALVSLTRVVRMVIYYFIFAS